MELMIFFGIALTVLEFIAVAILAMQLARVAKAYAGLWVAISLFVQILIFGLTCILTRENATTPSTLHTTLLVANVISLFLKFYWIFLGILIAADLSALAIRSLAASNRPLAIAASLQQYHPVLGVALLVCQVAGSTIPYWIFLALKQ